MMDKNAFTSRSPGKLAPITTPVGRDWAFIPDGLPPKWDFDPQLWPLLVEAKEALGTLNGIGQILPQPELLLRPLRNREALTSSKIEGTYVTPEQLLLFELNPTESNKPSDRAADWMEVHNYGLALKRGCELLKSIPIFNRLAMTMHAALLQGTRGKNKTPGDFRNAQVQIGSSGRFMPPPASELARLTTNLETYINNDTPELDPLVKCFVVHYQFETIHPFLDGNGRIGRALLALMIYAWLGHSHPWLYMSAFYEQFRDEYVERLYRVSTEGAWSEWVEFCLRGAIQQAKDAVRRCHEFNRLKKEFHQRVQSPTPRTHAIIEGLFMDPIVRISTLAHKFDIAYPTAKADVELLIKSGILYELAGVYPRAVYSSEVFRIAYSEEIQMTEGGVGVI
jgi:Fic family protein